MDHNLQQISSFIILTMLQAAVLVTLWSLTVAIQCYTEANRNLLKAYTSPYLAEKEYEMCTITTHLDPQKKIITNVLMFGEKNVVPRLRYEFDQNEYVLKIQYSCFDEHCNSVDELMRVLRDESVKKDKGSALAGMTLLAIESQLMKVTPGKFGERQGVVYALCAYMLTLFAMIAFIHMTTTFLMYVKHFNKKKPA